MPVSPPTYGAAYDQTEQNANAALLAGAIDTAAGGAPTKVQLANALTVIQNRLFPPSGDTLENAYPRKVLQKIIDTLNA